MHSFRSVTIEITTTHELQGLVETYQEIAAGKMQRIRHETITSREFIEGLAKLSEAVGADLVAAVSGRAPKTAAVWVSANAGLFGDIVEKTMVPLLQYVHGRSTDMFVLGEIGKQLMATLAPDVRYVAVPFSDDSVDTDSLKRLMAVLAGYEQVVLFFGKFQSIAIQSADQRVVSGASVAVGTDMIDEEQRRHREWTYIYEPTPSYVSNVMVQEITGSIVEQTIREGQLAKYASRLIHLDEAMDHIAERLDILMVERRKMRKIREDRKQRTMLSGMRTRR